MEPNHKRPASTDKERPTPRIDASSLLAAGKEVILVHNEQEYRLRITSNDKLILTK
jgi:hemin uptake protein HemP